MTSTHLPVFDDEPGQPPRGGAMSDRPNDHQPASTPPATLAQVLDGLEPMGDLSRFAIEDLTPAEEDEFFRILEEA